MKFQRIQEPGTYGYTASVGDRTVEVLRSYPGDWFCFATIDRKVCKSTDGRHYLYSEALRQARAFLNHELTWEIWP